MRIGALSLFSGVTLPRLLAAATVARSASEIGRRDAPTPTSSVSEAARPTATRPPGRTKAVVLLNLFGGPSHIDTFDLKAAAPVEVRGEFKPIATSVPGLAICEHLPQTARRMHRATLIRTHSHPYNSHNPYNVLTGFSGGSDRENYFAKRTDHPSMGSVCQYVGIRPVDAPAYVMMPAHPGYSQGLRRAGPYGGYLGSQFDPCTTQCEPTFQRKGSFYDPVLPLGDPFLPSLDGAVDLTADRLGGRRSLLRQIDSMLATLDASRVTERLSHFQREAFALLTSAKTRAAFDLSREPDSIRQRYGRHLYGSSMLVARRLVETGTTFVAVNWECAAETHGGHWDMHENNFGMLRFNLPVLDQIYAALIDDLDQRGLLDSTLVVVMGEMGRTPKVNAKAGRDHWPQCGFCLLTGGGTKQGFVYGTTDKHAAYPTDHPVSSGDIVATIYQLLGVDPQTHLRDLSDRPVPIAHGGSPLWSVIA